MVSRPFEVEYTDLDLQFDRRLVRDFISELIHAGYSIYWNENINQFIIAIRSGRKLVKLRFDRLAEGYKLGGNYMLHDPKLAELLEKMIGDTKGNAIVKRFHDPHILIDSIVSGELIQRVEVDGDACRTIFVKQHHVTEEELEMVYQLDNVERRIPILRKEVDDALEELIDLIEHDAPSNQREQVIARLQVLRQELILTESI
jgi:hypothetical protein